MKKNNKGFTLIELMAAIIVLIIIIFIAITKVNESSRRARDEAVKANAATYIKAVNNYVAVETVDDDTLENTALTLPMLVDHVKISGTKPDSANFVISDSEVVSACLEYNGYKITYNNGNLSSISAGTCENSSLFSYRGSEQIYTVPQTGVYRLEAWGAQGGSYDSTYYGGYGGYSVGEIYLTAGEILYLNIGGKGSKPTETGYVSGGYNGGGDGYTVTTSCSNSCSSGGGATSIAKTTGLLKNVSKSNIILVAGGGGGASYRYCGASDYCYSSGGNGGGLSGTTLLYTQNYFSYIPASGGTQLSGGLGGTTNGESGAVSGAYGQGARTERTGGYSCGTGGGGGFYGGGNGMFLGGGGGSGYIGNSNLFNKHMTCYECTAATNTIVNSEVSSTPATDKSKKGDGAVRITYVATETSNNSNEALFAYTGTIQTFTAPKTGNYKLEVWGAQGGNTCYNANCNIGGYGAYSTGTISLEQGEKLYIAVGDQGGSINYRQASSIAAFDESTGYNGGGYAAYYNNNSSHAGGGGATSITTSPALLSEFESNRSAIVIVAGGGGGAATHDSYSGYSGDGGHGGGIVGGNGNPSASTCYHYGTGGTQTAVGSIQTCSSSGRSSRDEQVTNNLAFGVGSNYLSPSSGTGYAYSGGGAGLFGGQSGYHAPGGAGSGYINTTKLSNAGMYCYNCTESGEPETKTTSVTCVSGVPTKNCAKAGSGYAKITLVE